MIRLGTLDDADEAVELIKESYLAYHLDNGYIPCELPFAYRTYYMHVNHPNMAAILYYPTDEHTKERLPAGLMMVYATQHIFSKAKIAKDTIWWISPEVRSYKGMKEMIQYYESWAKEQNCDYIGLAHMQDVRVGKLYERFGYKPVETTYMKPVSVSNRSNHIGR